MDFIASLVKICESSDAHRKYICIKSNHEQPLLMRLLVTKLSVHHNKPFQAINVLESPLQQIVGQLGMSFLGTSYIYWLRNVMDLSAADQKMLYKFLEESTSDHIIILNTELTAPLKNKDSLIIIPDKLNYDEGHALIQFLYEEQITNFISRLYEQVKAVSSDTLIICCHYYRVLGKGQQQFFDMWLKRIIAPEHSLFAVSTSFFARQPKLFNELWKEIKHQYPDEFWIAYWSEQLWQALIFIEKAAVVGSQEARKSVSRLPFSFMQKDWQKYRAHELIAAHELLYSIDHSLKNGAGSLGIELFVQRFVNHRMLC